MLLSHEKQFIYFKTKKRPARVSKSISSPIAQVGPTMSRNTAPNKSFRPLELLAAGGMGVRQMTCFSITCRLYAY